MPSALVEIEAQMSTISLDASSEQDLSQLIALLNRGRRTIDGYLAQIATVSRRRETTGSGPAPNDLFRSGGEVSRAEAERLARRGAIAAEFPRSAETMHEGRTRTENMDTLVRLSTLLTETERARLAEADTAIADQAMALPPETFTHWLRRRIRSIKADDQPSTAEQQKAASTFSMGRKRNGMWWLSGELDPERGAVVDAAIRSTARDFAADETPTAATRAAALVELVVSGGTGEAPARLGIGYLVDVQTLAHGPHNRSVAQTWSGDEHDPGAVLRLACDSDWYAVLINKLGRPDAVRLTRRSASRDQRLALRTLYRCCPLDGTPFDRCEIHHVNTAFEQGGPTQLNNLVPISREWHHRIHDRGWTLRMKNDRSLELRRPNGQLDRTVPAPAPLTRQRE